MMRRASVLLSHPSHRHDRIGAPPATARTRRFAIPSPTFPLLSSAPWSRTDFDWKWPFSIGHGTLGCSDAAIVFRYDGKTYALNAAARSRGFAIVDPIWRWQSGGMPSDPLRRLSQEIVSESSRS